MYSICTNVDDVSMFVHHDVSIVSVFDLKEVAYKGIGCHASDEITTSLERESKETGHIAASHLSY